MLRLVAPFTRTVLGGTAELGTGDKPKSIHKRGFIRFFLLDIVPLLLIKTAAQTKVEDRSGTGMASMTMDIQREPFTANEGYQYLVSFKPNLAALDLNDQVHARVPVEASLSVSETGDLADIVFTLPKLCRTEQALTFIRRQVEARVAAPQVFLTVPGSNGDAVASAMANLDLDLGGRIIGMEIRWRPDVASS